MINEICHDPAGFTKFLIVGGNNGVDYVPDVEVLDLGNSGSQVCSQPSVYPRVQAGAVGVLAVPGNDDMARPLVCGGHDKSSQLDTCYFYNAELDRFDAAAPLAAGARNAAASAATARGLFVSGGNKDETSDMHNTFEVYDNDGFSLVPGWTMPTGVRYHCMLSLDESTLIVLGGEPQPSSPIGDAFLIDTATGEVSQLPSMPTPREGFACGLVNTDESGPLVVVASGDTADILDLESAIWRPGPPLPKYIIHQKSAQLGNSFVSIGGMDKKGSGRVVYGDIYYFDPDSFDWIKMDQELSVLRHDFAIVGVPDDQVQCS